MPYHHFLEPKSLLQQFFTHPPLGFRAELTAEGVPTFKTPFDLLTTMAPAQRERLAKLPGFKWWHKALVWQTCFVGTTVTEYTPLPQGLSAAACLNMIKQQFGDQQALTIIKDLPQASPLLPEADNQQAAAMMAAAKAAGFIQVEGQALAYVPLDFTDVDEYMSRFSAARRKNFRRKLRSQQAMRVEVHLTGSDYFTDAERRASLYQLYLAVYEQSEVHFDLLSAAFFDALLQDGQSGGHVLFYWHEDVLVGYNICYVAGDKLIDKYIGLNYSLAKELNLYFVSWFQNLTYALSLGLKFYVAGWTDPEVKATLGASFTFTHHLVWVRSGLLRAILRRLSHHFESDGQWQREQQ